MIDFPDNVREEIARVINDLDISRLLALREFLAAWTAPAPRRSKEQAKAETQAEYEDSLKLRVQCPAIALGDNPSDPAPEPESKLQPVKKREHVRKFSDDQLKALQQEGLTCREIAERLGMNWMTIRGRSRNTAQKSATTHLERYTQKN